MCLLSTRVCHKISILLFVISNDNHNKRNVEIKSSCLTSNNRQEPDVRVYLSCVYQSACCCHQRLPPPARPALHSILASPANQYTNNRRKTQPEQLDILCLRNILRLSRPYKRADNDIANNMPTVTPPDSAKRPVRFS